jgi:hypothetical protein
MTSKDVEAIAVKHGLVNIKAEQQPWNDDTWQGDYNGGPSILLWRRDIRDPIGLQISSGYEYTAGIGAFEYPEILDATMTRLRELLDSLYERAPGAKEL